MKYTYLSATTKIAFWLINFILIGLIIFFFISLWKVFEKAGKKGWIALIPLYNICTFFEISWGNGIYSLAFLTVFIPKIGYTIFAIVLIVSWVKLAKAFGKDGAFAVGLILLTIIFFPILAFSDDAYVGVLKKIENKNSTNGYCRNCGTPLAEDAEFCHNCGTPKQN